MVTCRTECIGTDKDLQGGTFLYKNIVAHVLSAHMSITFSFSSLPHPLLFTYSNAETLLSKWFSHVFCEIIADASCVNTKKCHLHQTCCTGKRLVNALKAVPHTFVLGIIFYIHQWQNEELITGASGLPISSCVNHRDHHFVQLQWTCLALQHLIPSFKKCGHLTILFLKTYRML